MDKRLLNIEEASRYMGISKGSLYKMAWQGRFPFVVRVGRALRFDKLKMDLWIEENTEKTREI